MKVQASILAILSSSTVEANLIRLPAGKLDRKVYDEVNKALSALGGKWDRRSQAHVFAEPAGDVLDEVLLTGEYRRTKQDFGQFDTPPEVVGRVINLAAIEPGMTVLEPSAGIGNIALAAAAAGARVMCYEIDQKRCETLVAVSARAERRLDMVVQRDFLGADPAPVYDRVLMNPPFAKQADIEHVSHAAKFLKPGGRLVAVMSASVTFRTDRRAASFRERVAAAGGVIEALPEASFKASGTAVSTVLVVFDV